LLHVGGIPLQSQRLGTAQRLRQLTLALDRPQAPTTHHVTHVDGDQQEDGAGQVAHALLIIRHQHHRLDPERHDVAAPGGQQKRAEAAVDERYRGKAGEERHAESRRSVRGSRQHAAKRGATHGGGVPPKPHVRTRNR
jgi:hypothetical protein